MPPKRTSGRSSFAGAGGGTPASSRGGGGRLSKFGSSKSLGSGAPSSGSIRKNGGPTSVSGAGASAASGKYGRAARKKADKAATVPRAPPRVPAEEVPPPPRPIEGRQRVKKARRFAVQDRVQARLEDSSIVLGTVRRVYEARDETGSFVGRYKIEWEGEEMQDFSDAESDQLEEYEAAEDSSPFFNQFFFCFA